MHESFWEKYIFKIYQGDQTIFVVSSLVQNPKAILEKGCFQALLHQSFKTSDKER